MATVIRFKTWRANRIGFGKITQMAPHLIICGLSATLPNIKQALHVLLGSHYNEDETCVIKGHINKALKP